MMWWTGKLLHPKCQPSFPKNRVKKPCEVLKIWCKLSLQKFPIADSIQPWRFVFLPSVAVMKISNHQQKSASWWWIKQYLHLNSDSSETWFEKVKWQNTSFALLSEVKHLYLHTIIQTRSHFAHMYSDARSYTHTLKSTYISYWYINWEEIHTHTHSKPCKNTLSNISGRKCIHLQSKANTSAKLFRICIWK